MSRIISGIIRHFSELICLSIAIVILVLSLLIDLKILLFIPLFYAVVFVCELTRYFILRKSPLYIETPCGTNEPYHPSVLYFKDGWNGYKYWMAFTPMPDGTQPKPYVDRWERPCVYASNDGKTFTDIHNNGFLDELTENEIANKGYFSDCHLVYDDAKDNLVLVYRLTDYDYEDNYPREHVHVLSKRTSDGKNWSDREILINLDDNDSTGWIVVSPAIIRDNGLYKIWYVSSYDSPYCVSFSSSRNLKDWTKKQDCILSGRKVAPWHIDCIIDAGKYLLLVFDFTNELTLWESVDGLNFTFKKVILKKSNTLGAFYSMGLYRACMTKAENIKIYFSAIGCNYCKLGLMEGSDYLNMKVVNAGRHTNIKFFFKDYTTKYFGLVKRLFE